jgi:hypothetical protein
MAPDELLSNDCAELRSIAARIQDYQDAKKLNDTALYRLIGEIGSTKTYRRILDDADALEDLNLERQLTKYRSALAALEVIGQKAGVRTERYEDIFATLKLRAAVGETMMESGLARCIFLIGPSGSGKTEALQALRDKYGRRVVSIRASVGWNDRPSAMLAAIIAALSEKEPAAALYERLNDAIALLRGTRRCLMIEDSHHMGPRCLNLVITLIDETPGEFILAAIDTLWRKIEGRAYEECRQLTGNRIAGRINIGHEVRESDVFKLVRRGVSWLDGEEPEDGDQVIGRLAAMSRGLGRLGFVREVIKRANEKAAEEQSKVTREIFRKAITDEEESR